MFPYQHTLYILPLLFTIDFYQSSSEIIPIYIYINYLIIILNPLFFFLIKSSQIKQDLINKRRHAGGRQLSTIADGPDQYESICIAGYEKPMDNQEVSYSNLLSPTIKLNHGKKAKIHASEHNLINRCISYDSAVTYSGKQSVGNNHYHLLHQITAPSVLNDSESNLLRDKHQYHGYPTTFLKYNPDILDDPELITGKHSTLLDFPSYLVSTIIITFFCLL